MDITAAAQEHRRLVERRATHVAELQSGQLTQDAFNEFVRPLDSRIGHLAQAFNPRIADKAKRWLRRGI